MKFVLVLSLLIGILALLLAFRGEIEDYSDSVESNSFEIERDLVHSQSNLQKKTYPGRNVLPLSVEPSFYQLSIEPNWSNFTFQASCVIDVSILEETNKIVFHSYQLTFNEVVLLLSSTTIPIVLRPLDIVFHEELKRVELIFENNIPPTTGKLFIDYSGIINDQMSGFYRSTYQGSFGMTELLTTQMEPTDARRVFPCWDEPDIKAQFQISFVVPSNLTVLSNMPVEAETKIKNGLKVC